MLVRMLSYTVFGRVAELVYAYVSEAYPVRVGSSNLPAPTLFFSRTFFRSKLVVRGYV